MKTITENKYFIFDNPHVYNLKWFVKNVLYFPFEAVYHCRLAFCRVKPRSKKYKVAICAIFKNEALYLKEWIEVANYFSDKIFKKKLLRKAGLSSKFRFHDCRHTHATWLLEQNVDIKTISERLGHKSIRITLDTYAHVVPKLQQGAVDVLQDILHPAA